MCESVFGAAKWIGSPRLNLHTHTMSVFQLSYQVRLLEGSTRAGFLFGGNDARLMDQNKNLQGVETKINESYVALVLDIQPLKTGKSATFSAFRYGYCRDDGNAPLHQTDIPLEVLNTENAHRIHTIQVRCVYGQIEVHMDGCLLTKNDRPFGGDVWNLNPVGEGNNFICFPLLCDVGIKLEPGQRAAFSNLEIRNYREPCSLLYTTWKNGCTFCGDRAGLLQLFDPSHGSMTSLRTAFHLEKPIRRATIVATARGIYELFLNGNRVGQDWFAPGLSQYNKTHYPDMPEYEEQSGMLMLENIRGALCTDVAVLRDGIQTIRPHFTFHGYRYVEITGIDAPLPLEAVRGLALSSVDVTAEFSCSDPDITRLYQNICWSLRDNCISIPTDCPQRNERMGWSGDLSVFSGTMVQMADCEQFLRRHLQALRDTQSAEGRFDDVAPVGGGFGGILWGSAGITVPWALYQQTGNEEILSEHFDAMVQYGRFLRSKLDEKGLVSEGPLGDWLGPENEKNEPQLLWQSYYVYDLEIILRCAEILNQPEIQKEFTPDREQARDAFHRWFLDPDTGRTIYSSESVAKGEGGMGGPPRSGPPKELPPKTAAGQYLMDTQTSYAVPLALGVLYSEAAEQAKKHLGEAVRRTNCDDAGVERPPYSLMTGFIGTAWILWALSQGGMDREAWRMLRNTSYPSWLYPVKQGATTIWERLDSFTLDRGFGGNNAMNSFNHYSFGAVGSWMLSRALGFEWDGAQGQMVLNPTPDPDGVVTWAEGSVLTGGGRYTLRWEQNAQEITYLITVPAGHTALLRLPADASGQNIIRLKEGNSRFVVPCPSQQGECTQHGHAGKE